MFTILVQFGVERKPCTIAEYTETTATTQMLQNALACTQ